jgi:hypothetical protein
MTSNASVALVSNAGAFGETPDSRARFKMLEDLRFLLLSLRKAVQAS